MHLPRMFAQATSPLRATLQQHLAPLGLLLCLAASPAAHAIDVDLDVDGTPAEACLATEKTLRMILNIWANAATETYAQVRTDLEKGLGEHGERGQKVLTVYKEMIPRVEANEFLPPKVISRWAGHQALRAETHTLCMKTLAN